MAIVFGEQAAKQIAKAVRIVLGQDRNSLKRGQKFRPVDRSGRLHLAKTDASHAKGVSGSVTFYRGTPGSETTTGISVTAFNKFADLASGAWVWVDYQDGNAYLISAECV